VHGRWSGEARDTIALLRWLGRSSRSAVALVRDGRLELTNHLFRELEARGGEWRWSVGPHLLLRYPGLRELVLGEAGGHLQRGDAVRTSRYECGALAIELRLEPLPTASGPAVVALIHDVSQALHEDAQRMRDREQRLHEQGMHAMGVATSGLAHDLNHSLHVLALRVATMRSDARFAGAADSLDALSGVVEQAASAVARLQDLARRRRDQPGATVDLTAVLLGSLEMARTDLDGGGQRVRIDEEVPPLPLVRGTAAELSQLFAELLAGALDATPTGGAVEVRAGQRHGSVVVTVADQGPRLPEGQPARVFDPLYSGRGARPSLSIVYGVMRRLGGSISAAARPGSGALFTLTFPLAVPQQQREQPRGGLRPAGRLRVLLVDDEVDNLEILQELLVMEGHQVTTATSGRAALDRFQLGERYDVVLCDVGMPAMSGWQLVREVQRIAEGTRIYLLTGWANEISERDPRLEGVSGVLGKPLDLERLRERLAEPEQGRPGRYRRLDTHLQS
jgi:signal transduction histidine kinase/ActR/RegA family two-component response regulator